MFGFLKSIGKNKSEEAPRVEKLEAVDRPLKETSEAQYEHERSLAQSQDVEDRLNLAKDNGTHREILYYLAENDPDPEVRRAVAENVATPVQAATLLAEDDNVDVREALVGRLVNLLPDLDDDQQSQLYAYSVEALGRLALDEVLKIRKALASTLKDHAHAPPKVAGQLARDIERDVSEPILRFCARIDDEDLIDILKSHPENWAAQAIAGREKISEDVSDAVIEYDDKDAGIILLQNDGAAIREETVKKIINKSKDYQEWQAPLAINKNLPEHLTKQLADFADQSVKDLLENRDDIDEETKVEIFAAFRRRLSFADYAARHKGKSAYEKVLALELEGQLTEEMISDAVALREKDFVYAAIAKLAETNSKMVEKIFSLNAAKPIVALTWKAGLSMRMALQLQKQFGQVQPRDLLYPKDGIDYPMTKDELNWQLEFVGLKTK